MDCAVQNRSPKPSALVVLWSGSAYNSLQALLHLAAEIMIADGWRVETVTIGTDGWGERLQHLLESDHFSLALGMSGVGSDLTTENGMLLWEATKTPFFDWCCDHPCYYPSRHRRRNPYLLHGYVFPDHAAYAAFHLGQRLSTFPVHIGIPKRTLFAEAPLGPSERSRNIIFVKSGADPNRTTERWRAMPKPFGDLLLAAAEDLMLRGSTADVLPTLQRLGASECLILDADCDFTLGLIREVDAYVRFSRANLVLKALMPYPVDVYGTGWDHVDWSQSRAAHCGTLDFDEMMALLPRHLGSVSLNPLVDGSVHDRVSFALSAGVVPISDANAFWRLRLPRLAPYGFTFEADAVSAAVEALLDDPASALERAEATYADLDLDMSFRASVHRVIAIAAAHRP